MYKKEDDDLVPISFKIAVIIVAILLAVFWGGVFIDIWQNMVGD